MPLSEFQIKSISMEAAFHAFHLAELEPKNQEFERCWQLIANAIMQSVPPRKED